MRGAIFLLLSENCGRSKSEKLPPTAPGSAITWRLANKKRENARLTYAVIPEWENAD